MRKLLLLFILLLPMLNISSQTKGVKTGLYIVIPKDFCSEQKNISEVIYQSDTLCINNKPIVTVSDIELCSADSTKLDGKEAYALSIKLKKSAAEKFAKITEENVGKKIAMIIDNKVIMAAVLRDPVLSGGLTISGESWAVLKKWEKKLNKEIMEIKK